MKRTSVFLLSCSAAFVMAGAKLPAGKELFKTEALINSHKLAGLEIRTFYTSKSYEELSKELKLQLGENWKNAEAPKVKMPEVVEENSIDLGRSLSFENIADPKLRVSITVTQSPDQKENKSLLVLTLMSNYKAPEEETR